jgi:peptidoglycan/LPS O-acetylase OafA/YrhL
MVLSWNVAAQMHPVPGSLVSRVQALARLNWSGVDLFFVLSGFLIGGILLDTREATNGLSTFYLRRICRIFPIYYASLMVFVLARAWVDGSTPGSAWLLSNQGVGGVGQGTPSPIPTWTYFLYLQNIWMASTNSWGAGWLGITWSLAVEEQFYLLFPPVVLLTPRRALLALCVALFGFAAFFRAGHEGLASYCLLPARIDALMVGVAIAILLRYRTVVAHVADAGPIVKGSLLALVVVFAALVRRPSMLGPLDHSFLALLYGGALLCCIVFPRAALARVLALAPLRGAGQISYGLYLFHEPIMGAAHAWFYGRAPRVQSLGEFGVSVLALLAAGLLAAASYEYFERHVVAIGKRRRYVGLQPA